MGHGGSSKTWSSPIGPEPTLNIGDIRNHPEYGMQIWDGKAWIFANINGSQLYDTLKVGTILRIGHPANGVAWIKIGENWITNNGRVLTREEMFDTLEHGAFVVLIKGR